MIALDASAVVAIALGEPEEEVFSKQIALHEAVIGTPTIFETRLVLSSKIDQPDRFMEQFIGTYGIHPVAFTIEMYYLAIKAFDRFGKGFGHPAQLNFGDCMSYAVSKHYEAPLLFKGTDFGLTDIPRALP